MIINKLIAITAITMSINSFANSEDSSSKFNKMAKEACLSESSRTLTIGHGDYYFYTPLEPFPCALNIKGDGVGSTKLIRQFNGGAFLHWKRGADQSGGSIQDLAILAGKDTNKGIAIYVQSDVDTDNTVNSYNRHFFTVSGVLIGRDFTSNTSWDHGIYLDGSLNPDNTNGIAAGIRISQISNTSISGTNVSSIYLNKARGVNLLNVDCFIPINGSFAGVILDNSTQGVKLDSRSCIWRFQDDASIWMLFNGRRIR